MIYDIYIIDNSSYITDRLKDLFKADKKYKFKQLSLQMLEQALKDIPALIIINEDTIEEDVLEVCLKIRNNEDNSITPIVVTSSNIDGRHVIDVLKKAVNHYVIQPLDEEYIYYTIKNTIELLYSNRKVSPLTGLPGNVQIQAEMKKRLIKNKVFAMFYFDLDNFKAYNDVYGFFMGDEIIKFTAKCIQNNINSLNLEDTFIGHIGGDDFVAIVGECDYESICQKIISDFDNEVKKYFSDIDTKRGYLEVANRKGIIEKFPLTSISIGVVEVDTIRFQNVLQIGEVGAQVKHLAKSILGSAYTIDRRKKVENKNNI